MSRAFVKETADEADLPNEPWKGSDSGLYARVRGALAWKGQERGGANRSAAELLRSARNPLWFFRRASIAN